VVELENRLFSFILTTDALRPDFVNSAFCTTIGSFPIITTFPERSSIAVFIVFPANNGYKQDIAPSVPCAAGFQKKREL